MHVTTIDQRIAEALREAAIDCDIENLDPEQSFRDNGIDSLDVMGLFLAIEEKYDIKFSEAESDAIKTPAALSLALDGKLA